MSPSLMQILIVVVLVLIFFGRGRISNFMGDLASGIKEIKFNQSKKIIGKDTKGALLAGYNTGYKLLIEAYIELLQKKYRNKFKVIFTGGYASYTLNRQSKFTYKEDITLLGISYYRNLYLK